MGQNVGRDRDMVCCGDAADGTLIRLMRDGNMEQPALQGLRTYCATF